MSSLGQLLLDRAWITEAQLDLAIDRQQQMGGRLGTCFLELGCISEEFLLQALSEQLHAPAATAEDLNAIAPAALALLPTETAIRSRAIPFRLSGTTVDIAMLDVGDLTLEDELSFIVSKRVKFHVAVELRLVEALARYYGCDIPLRLSTLAHQLSNAPEVRPAAAVAPVTAAPDRPSESFSDSPSLKPARPIIPRQAHHVAATIPLTMEERAALTDVREPASKPVDEESPAQGFSIDLVRAETSTEIGQALLSVLSEHFIRVLLFRVSGSSQEITGWFAEGPDIDNEWFENYSIGLRQSSIFRRLLSKPEIFVGHLETHPSHLALARCWGGSLDAECLLMPVFVRKRLVCVAYCDRAALGLPDIDLPLVKRLGNKAAIAFERCILRLKLQSD